MIEAAIIAGLIGAALLVWLLTRKSGAVGDGGGLTIGPRINGKNYSPGYPMTLTRQGTGWSVTLAPDRELGSVIDHDFRIPPEATALRFHYRAEIDEAWPTEAPDSPPLVSLMIQREGDNWSSEGKYEFYRFYSPPFPLETGEHVREVPLEGWIGVSGKTGDMAPAIANLGSVSVVFGHPSGRAHGVSGRGQFTLISLKALRQ